MKSWFKNWFSPNESPTQGGGYLIVLAWLVLLILLWNPLMPKVFPTLGEIFSAFGPLVQEHDFFAHWIATLKLTFFAIGFSVLVSFVIAYLSIFPFFRPMAFAISKARFLSLVGFVVLFIMLADSNVQTTRIYLLMFGVVPYLTTSLTAIIIGTDRAMFDYARSLGLSPWQSTWHVLIAGKAGDIMEGIRQNLAIAFTMIVYVESTLREGGGVGTLLFDLKKYAHGYDQIFAVQLSVLGTGILIDFIFQEVNKAAFPFSFIKRKREV
jgi:ABC-type nitrate/sulfonate/bicarbonate transport system permease component